MERVLTVTGTGHITVAPDMAILSLTLEKMNRKYEVMIAQVDKAVDSLREELERIGISGAELKTTGFDVDTRYADDIDCDKKHIFLGYSGRHELSLAIPMDNELLGKCITVLSHTEGKPEINISFSVKDKDALKNLVIEDAVRNAKLKADILSKAAGVKLGNIIKIEYSWGEPHFRSRFKTACKRYKIGEINPEDIEESDSVTVVWQIE